ncbi:hypothetical protein [Isoptericola croceus]|uniref:hypothetical protein n=1 Tax=Isoptericola croceus TaxID=3031406 RepID=UPI0023F81B99|nr:hypothetical protein [Isoptericola croceus]
MSVEKPSPARQPALTKSFLKIAVVEGAVLVAAVLLFVQDVIPFGLFIGVMAACVAGSGIAILRTVRQEQARLRAEAEAEGSGTTSGSTIDPANPFTS